MTQIPFPTRKVTRAVAEAELAILERTYPAAVTELEYDSPFTLLIAVILSAQCTDARVNLTTPFLFAAYPTPQALAGAPLEDVERIVKSCGFFRMKAKNIVAASRALVECHGGDVPRGSRCSRSVAGRRTQNGERRNVGRFRRGGIRGRHARLSRLASFRSHARQDARARWKTMWSNSFPKKNCATRTTG